MDENTKRVNEDVNEERYVINEDGLRMTYAEWLEMRKAEMDR